MNQKLPTVRYCHLQAGQQLANYCETTEHSITEDPSEENNEAEFLSDLR